MTTSPVEFQTHGLLANYWAKSQNPLEHFHRHNEIELNLLCSGKAVQMIAGQSNVVPLKRLAVFWAGFSHRYSVWEPGVIWSLAVPLSEFLGWSLPNESFVHRLMHGEMLVESDESRWPFDLDLISRWHTDLHSAHAVERSQIVLLEVHARLRRLAGNVGRSASFSDGGAEPRRIEQMLQFIAGHYQEELSVAEIAATAKLTPSYAMELFKDSTGMSIMQYVNDQRLAHARRMLATTNAKILDVAMQSGFGSESQFYNVFRNASGQTPREYANANSGHLSRKTSTAHPSG